MGVQTTRAVSEVVPISRSTDAAQLAQLAYDRMVELLRTLDDADWRARTPCPAWDVADMVGHVIGAAEAGASVRTSLRQQRWARRNAHRFGDNTLDAANALQVDEHRTLRPDERIEALREVAPRAVRGRMRLPRPMRRISIPLDAGGSTAAGMPTSLTLGELMDVIYTRDTWMHALDIADATGRVLPEDRHLDERIVEDAVASWASAHERPFTLTVTGAVTLRLQRAGGGPSMQLDAYELCRRLSGRGRAGAAVDHDGLLDHLVVF